MVNGRLANLARRILGASSRFLAIARSDGVNVALIKVGRKIRRKLGLGRLLASLLGIGRCPYFAPPTSLDPYEAWQRVNQDNPRRRRWLKAAVKPPGKEPRFSVIVPVYNPPIDVFRAMIGSVLDQTVADWELVLVDDASPDARVRQELAEWSGRDRRIRVIERPENGNISVATNDAAAAARGEFLVLLDHDDLLDRDALAHLSIYLEAHPEADLVYSDDDKIGVDGRRHSPQFKPDWSPELLLSFCYTGHLTAVRRRLYHEAGGMRAGFEGSQDHDFWLRASERARAIGHVPEILYHWRVVPGSTALSGHCKPASFEAGRRAVEEAFHRRGLACRVEHPPSALRDGCAIFQPVMPDDGPSVAILIPSRNHRARLKLAIDSLARTTYRNYRIYVIDNESDDPETLRYLAALPHRVLRIANPDGRFNFAAINNAAAAMVEEELLLFLNDDTEVIDPRWLSQMVGWSRLEGVGAVGARLLYPDGRVQHAGVVHGLDEGLAGHAFRLLPRWERGTFNLASVSRNCAAVTAACMLTPRGLFIRTGGFDETRFAVAYNDPDYCHRLVDAGYRIVYCAEAELTHHEGLSRGFSSDPDELAAYREIHRDRVDRYFSPHFDPEIETFQLKPTVVPIGSPSRPIPMLAVTHNLNWEGAPRIEFELVRRLQASGVVRAEVFSLDEGPLRRAFEQEGIPIRVGSELARIDSGMERYREGVAVLAEWIRERGFEVVHANTLRTFWAVEAARAAGVPSVWSVHESEPWQTNFDHLPTDLAAAALSCLAYPYRVVFSARSSIRVWSDLNTSGNFELIRFAHDVPLLRRKMETIDPSQARRELHVNEGDLCVLLMGTVCERKGQNDLLRAFASLPSPIATRMKCFVVGARETLAYGRGLVQAARKLPEDRRERFIIVPETGETAAYWRAADVFCCTSRVESYPLVTMEAMAAGLPIVTTPVFGIAEQVRPSVNALIYQPGDVSTLARHLASLVEDEPLRRSLAEASPRVLRSLPDDTRMNDLYRRTIRAAAESAPFFPAAPGSGLSIPATPHITPRIVVRVAKAPPRLRRLRSTQGWAAMLTDPPRLAPGSSKRTDDSPKVRSRRSCDHPEVARLRGELRLKHREIQELRDQLRAIHASDAWAILRTLGQLRHVLAPHGTRRDHLVRLAARGLRRLKKLAARLSHAREAASRSFVEGARGSPRVEAATRANHAVICLPMIEWHDRFQRPQQMMRQFARASHLVLYAANQFHGGTAARTRLIENNILEVVLPGDPAANVYQDTLAGGDCARMLAAIEQLGAELELSEAVVVAQHAYWTPLAEALRTRFGWPIVYDCMDDHAGFFQIAADVLETERRLIAAADLVVASSRRLYEGIRARSRRATLIRNACEYEHFGRDDDRPPPRPDNPTIGYYGAIAEWFDSKLVAKLAALRPSWRFELIGSTLAGNVRALEDLPNVRLLGECPYGELPGRIGGWDAFIIPFRRLPLTEATNPVKVYEMLATGKPMVAVGLPELVPIARKGLIRLAASAEKFAAAIERELNHDDAESAAARRAFARRNTWTARHRKLAEAIEDVRCPPSTTLSAPQPWGTAAPACLPTAAR